MMNTESLTILTNLLVGGLVAAFWAYLAGWTVGLFFVLPMGVAIGFMFCFPTSWIWDRFVYSTERSFGIDLIAMLLLPGLTGLTSGFATMCIVELFARALP